MHAARKSTLLALAAVAAMAFAAAPASATNAIQVVNETTATACSNLGAGHLTGGCKIHAAGTIELRVEFGFFEVHEYACNVELDMRIGGNSGNGESAIDDQELYSGDASCVGATPVVTECDLPWEGRGERDAGTEHNTAAFSAVCLNPAESDVDCIGNLAYSVVEVEATEDMTFTFNNAPVGVCEIDGDLAVETVTSQGDIPIHIN